MINKKRNIIVVTGGAGFVGSNLISLLVKKTSFKIYHSRIVMVFERRHQHRLPSRKWS